MRHFSRSCVRSPRRHFAKNRHDSYRGILTSSIVTALAVGGAAYAATAIWDAGAGSQEWNDQVNWENDTFPTGGFPDGVATINTDTGLFPIISADSAFTPSDILVGTGTGAAGRLDHTAGTAATGNGNWFFVGISGATGVYNLANTAAAGGTLTGFGTGSGSFNIGGANATDGRLYIGRDAGSTGTVNINTTGTLKIGNDLFVGQAGGTGTLNIDAGTINRNAGWTAVGDGAGSTGTLSMSGGTFNGVGDTGIGSGGGTGVINLSGGTFNVPNWVVATTGAGNSTINISGTGVFNQGAGSPTSRFELTNPGATGTATVNLNGGTLHTNGVVRSGAAAATAIFNFNGGTLKARVANGTFMQGLTRANVRDGGAVIDTDGLNITIGQPLLHSDIVGDAATDGGLTKNGAGTLTLSGASTYTGNVQVNAGTLIGGFTNVGNPAASAFGNATIAGRTITIASGATLRLNNNDSFGNQAAVAANLPSVILNGGTAITAQYNQVGALTLNGATLTSSIAGAGNYFNWQFLGDINVIGTTPSTINATVGAAGDGNHLDTSTTFNVADVTGSAASDLLVTTHLRNRSGNYGNTAGALVKAGTGTMELSGANVYTGATTITGGTLRFSGAGASNSSSGFEVNGTGAKLVQTSSIAVTPVVALTNGTVDGAGAISTINVADLATNTVANGNGNVVNPAQLTIDALTFAGAGRFNLLLSGATPGVTATTLTTSGIDGAITINASNTLWSNGSTYDLIGYTTLNGELADFTTGTFTGLGARQSATLGNSGTAITLSIAGDVPVWTGAGDGTWTTAVQTPKNWKLQTAGTPTDFLTNDAVLFDDTAAPAAPTVNIIQNVSPVSTTFANATKTYTVTSPGGFGIASGTVTKTAAGTLNLGGTHTYTGATLLNAGTTNLTGSLGNTPVAVASGATLNVQAANAITQNTVTVNGTYAQTVDNALGGTAAIVFNNGATLNNANAHSGGTTLAGGTVNVGNGAAFGTGPLTFAGGLLNNPGGPLTLPNALRLGSDAAAQTLSMNFANPVTFSGPVTGGTGGLSGVKTLDLSGPNISFTGNLTPGGASGLVINDNLAGALMLSGPASTITTLNMNGGAGSIVNIGAGNLTLSNGGANILQSTTGGTINGTGSLLSGGAGGDLGTAGGTTLTINAQLGGTNVFDIYNANGGPGLGTVILTAASTGVGGISVQNTKVVLPAGSVINANNVANASPVLVANAGGLAAELEISGGTINATRVAAPAFGVGTANGAVGTVTMTSGLINTTEMWLSNGVGGQATMNMSGGTVNTNSWLAIGRDNGTGTLNLSGGTVTKGGGAGSYVIIGSLGGTGTLEQTGGAFDATAGGIRLGENTGVTPSLGSAWNMSGGSSSVNGEIMVAWLSSEAEWNVSGTANVNATGRLIVGAGIGNAAINAGPIINGAPVGTVNLSGGSVTFNGADNRIGGDTATTGVNSNATATGIVNVAGGTLNFGGNLQIGAFGRGTMNISGTGVVNATGGFPVIGRFGGGVGTMNVNGGTFSHAGGGTQFIIGEEGTGTLNLNSGLVDSLEMRVGHMAAGNGTINLNGGTLLTSLVQKTDPGSTAAFRFNGGLLQAKASTFDFFTGFEATSLSIESGGAKIDTNGNDVSITQGLAPGATSGGGLTKQGVGTLTLVAANSYTGPTVIEAGTLGLSGSLSGSTSINVKTGATFDVLATGGGFTLAAAQTLRGAGTVIGLVTVAGTVAPGDTVGALTFTSPLTFNANSTLALEIMSATLFDQVVAPDVALNAPVNLALALGYTPAEGTTWRVFDNTGVGSSRVDLQACKLEYSIVSPK